MHRCTCPYMDVKSSDAQMHTPIYGRGDIRCTDAQMHMPIYIVGQVTVVSMWTWGHQMHRCTCPYMDVKSSDAQMHRCTRPYMDMGTSDAQMHMPIYGREVIRCTDAQMHTPIYGRGDIRCTQQDRSQMTIPLHYLFSFAWYMGL